MLDRSTFQSGGRDRVNAERVSRLNFKETRSPTLIRDSDGTPDAPAEGTFWIRESDGAVLMTWLHVGAGYRNDIRVRYCTPPGSRDLVPCTMNQRFVSAATGRLSAEAKYSHVRRFSVEPGTVIKSPSFNESGAGRRKP
ncbi:MAG: hypothetical protein H0W08_24575 [Acidobacteria bacterium]|nr:hypothetical protein [Acidobacteriota bacterium]